MVFGVHDRADAVVKVEAVRTGQARNLRRQSVAGERTGGDDRNAIFGNSRDLFTPQFDERLGFDGARHFRGEDFAVDSERMAAGNAGAVRACESAANRGAAAPP